MVSIAIGILWVLLGAIILGAVLYFAMKAIRIWTPIDPKVESAVWLCYIILVLIYILMCLAGGGLPHPHLF